MALYSSSQFLKVQLWDNYESNNTDAFYTHMHTNGMIMKTLLP